MVAAVLAGESQRSVARRFGVSLATVQLWVQRSKDTPLEQVDFNDVSHAPHHQPKQTPPQTEARILILRHQLKEHSDLGEYGAQAIQNALAQEVQSQPVPSIATINRLLKRNGQMDAHARLRRPSPPPGWYLPDVRQRRAEIDESDFVEDLAIEGGPLICVLNTISLHGGWCASWPSEVMRATFVQECLLGHWRQFGLPDYAQFDNGTVFQGPHQHPDTIGRVTRLCLSLNVTPVFAVPREFGLQSSVESYNNRWQQKVWQRSHVENLEQLCAYSSRYVAAVRQKNRVRFEAAPSRRAFPQGWSEPTSLPRTGCIFFLRRTSEQGNVELLGHKFPVSATWPNRLVRCEVDLVANVIRIYGLRRQEPDQHRLLQQWPHRLPDRKQK